VKSAVKARDASFNMVAQQLSEQQSHEPEVNLFCLNGFESYYKFTQKKKVLTYAVSGVTSNWHYITGGIFDLYILC